MEILAFYATVLTVFGIIFWAIPAIIEASIAMYLKMKDDP